jgi:MFS family permease
LRNTFRALRNRNFRLFFLGQGISLIGTWMQRVALGWLIYRVTHSELMLGTVVFLGQLPISLLSPFAGAVSDRIDKRKLLLILQTLDALQAAVLAALTLTNRIEIWHVIVLSVFSGLCNAFESPSQHAFLIEMTGAEDLMNAIALNSTLVNGSRLIGPSIAGFLVAFKGEGVVFFINAVSYIAVIFSLLAMRLDRKEKKPSEHGILSNMTEGLSYAFHSPPIRTILGTMAATTLAGSAYVTLMPVFAKDILGRGPETLGLLMGANGAGALTAALMLASRKSVKGLATVIAGATVVYGMALVGFSLSSYFYLSMALMFVVGITLMHQIAGTNTLIQTIVPNEMRGRVMSLFTMSFLGIMPFSSLIGGYVASKIGAPHTVTGAGAIIICSGIIYLTRLPKLMKMIHCIQVERGFIRKDSKEAVSLKDCE